jgi:hypothetical protein
MEGGYHKTKFGVFMRGITAIIDKRGEWDLASEGFFYLGKSLKN